MLKKSPSLRFYKTSLSLRGRRITMVISWTSTVENPFSSVSEKASPSSIVQVFIFHLPCLSWHDGSTQKGSVGFASPPNQKRSYLLQLHHLKTATGWLVHTREPGSQPFRDPQTYRPINQYQFGITHRFTDAAPVHNAGATVSGHFIHRTQPSLSLRGSGLFLLPPLLMVIHSGFMFKIVPLQRSTVRYSA